MNPMALMIWLDSLVGLGTWSTMISKLAQECHAPSSMHLGILGSSKSTWWRLAGFAGSKLLKTSNPGTVVACRNVRRRRFPSQFVSPLCNTRWTLRCSYHRILVGYDHENQKSWLPPDLFDVTSQFCPSNPGLPAHLDQESFATGEPQVRGAGLHAGGANQSIAGLPLQLRLHQALWSVLWRKQVQSWRFVQTRHRAGLLWQLHRSSTWRCQHGEIESENQGAHLVGF